MCISLNIITIGERTTVWRTGVVIEQIETPAKRLKYRSDLITTAF